MSDNDKKEINEIGRQLDNLSRRIDRLVGATPVEPEKRIEFESIVCREARFGDLFVYIPRGRKEFQLHDNVKVTVEGT